MLVRRKESILDGIFCVGHVAQFRGTLLLRDIDGLTTKEAALVLDVPHGTVKAQLARARPSLLEMRTVSLSGGGLEL